MELDINVKVTKEAYELGQGVTNFLRAIKDALKDGWQGKDIPIVLQAALTDLVPAMKGVENLPLEKQEDRIAFMNAFLQSGLDIMRLFQ